MDFSIADAGNNSLAFETGEERLVSFEKPSDDHARSD